MVLDFESYRNQLEACRITGGLVPHPAFQLMQSPSGLPMTTPWSVCAVGKPVQPSKPALNVRLPENPPVPAMRPWLDGASFEIAPVARSIPNASLMWRDLQCCRRATFWRVWTDYNVRRNGEDGMEIHAAFEIHNSQNREFQAIAFFYTDEGHGAPVMTSAEGFQTTKGGLCVWEYFTPLYRIAEFRDFWLFLPYRTIPFENCTMQSLKFYVVLREEDQPATALAKSDWQRFTLT
jgi:hypothetical protein